MNLLLENLAPNWILVSFPIIRIVLVCLMFIAAIVVCVTVLFQDDNHAGSNAITGFQESYYSKNKGGSKEDKLKKITIVCSVVIALCIILYFVSLIISNPTA